jgi:hypothetical protein
MPFSDRNTKIFTPRLLGTEITEEGARSILAKDVMIIFTTRGLCSNQDNIFVTYSFNGPEQLLKIPRKSSNNCSCFRIC